MKNANPVYVRHAWSLLLVAALFLTGCARSEAPKPAVTKTVEDHFAITVGGKVVSMQLAVLEPEMERGLMGRRDMGPDEGMIFVYLRPQQMSFWMHNTPTPLDIGFFNRAGELLEVYPMRPFDETPLNSRSRALQFALEMNQGWYAKHGVRPGAKIDLKALTAALQARDFDPKKFGLGQ